MLSLSLSIFLCVGVGGQGGQGKAMCSQLCRSSNYPRTCLCQTDFTLRHADFQAKAEERREGSERTKSSSSFAAPTSSARRQWLLGAASSCLSYCEVSSFVARFRFCLLCNCIGRPLAAAFKTGSQPAESRQWQQQLLQLLLLVASSPAVPALQLRIQRRSATRKL